MADDYVKKVDAISGALPSTQAAAASTGGATIPVTDATEDTAEADDQFDDVKKDLRKRFELLPEEIQQSIMDDKYQMQLFDIAKSNKLTYEQLSYLEMKTTMVLLGMIPPDDYRDELQVELKKNDPEIDVIVKAVNDEVFAPIRASIQKVYAVQNDPDNDIPDSIVSAASKPPQTISPIVQQAATPVAMPSAPAPATNLSSAEKTVLEKTGVVLSETPMPVKPATPAAMPSRSDIMQGIENPVKTPLSSIVADKLASVGKGIPASRTTDYSIPKTSTPPSAGPSTLGSSDPYREPIK